MREPTVIVGRAAGLKTHIWNNNFKSLAMLAVYPLLLLGLVWLCALVVSSFAVPTLPASGAVSAEFANRFVYEWWPAVLAVVTVWFLIAFFFHGALIRKLSHARPVTRSEEPELYNLLENLCIAAGMPMPSLNIIETHARNAFASGIDRRSFAVTVTRGLLNSLTKDEVEAVLAHELTHIRNRDVRLLIVTVIFTGMIGFASQMIWNSIRYNLIVPRSANRKGGSGIVVLLAVGVILWVGYVASLLMRFAISRNREYMADAGAVEMTKNPQAMMRALMRISGRDKIPETTGDIAMMCIENAQPFLGMFATHPPIERRIAAIAETTRTPVPETPHSGPAAKAQRFSGPQNASRNPWLVRTRGARKRL